MPSTSAIGSRRSSPTCSSFGAWTIPPIRRNTRRRSTTPCSGPRCEGMIGASSPEVRPVDSDLSLEFLRVVEQAAIACAQTMGQGDRHKSDQVAVEAMRREMDALAIDGTIVIGEGERDEAPMLYIGEKVGRGGPRVDIAVDPLEGTNLCATGSPNAIAVLATASAGGLLHAPDLYMEKLIVGPSSKDAVDLDAPVADNLKAIARRLD